MGISDKTTTTWFGLPAPIWVTSVIAVFTIAGLSLYEYAAFDWHPAREEAALFTPYHWLRMGFSALVAGAIIGVLWRHHDKGYNTPAAMSGGEIRFAAGGLLFAIAATLVMMIDPVAFHAMAAEDRPLECASALLLFAGSGFFLIDVLRRLRGAANGGGTVWIGLAIASGFAGLLFLIGMEEISWGQRIIGFETPGAVADMNWQSEFNFHNIQTDLSEFAYYLAAGVLLIVAPLLRETIGGWAPLRYFEDFLPGRTTAAVAAPMVFLTYGRWNLVPIQILMMLTALTMLIFAANASSRGRNGEKTLFFALAAAIALGQILVLAFGPRMIEIFDVTEFRELFIALGLACFAAQYYFRSVSAEPEARPV